MLKHITIIDVARDAGVSMKTVSRVLNNEPHVRPDKRNRVLSVIATHGYTRNLVAREFASNATRIVAFVFMSRSRLFPHEHYFADIFDDAQRTLAKADYSTLFSTPEELAPESAADFVAELVRKRRLAGVLLADLLDCDFSAFARTQIPIVVLGRHARGPRMSGVLPTDAQGMFDMVAHVHKLGHRRIGFLGRIPHKATTVSRLAGYDRALMNLNLLQNPGWVYDCEDNSTDAAQAMAQRLVRQPRLGLPTALCAASDLIASVAVREFHRAGVRVPQDISVTGFDDNQYARLTDPGLTTVSVPRVEMGQKAAEELIRLIAPENEGRVIEVPTRLVQRESAGPPPLWSGTTVA